VEAVRAAMAGFEVAAWGPVFPPGRRRHPSAPVNVHRAGDSW